MTGELDPMPLADILGAVGYRTAMGVWPAGFDEAHAVLTLVQLTERLRQCVVGHHDADRERLGPLFDLNAGAPCAICLTAQGAAPDEVLTDLKAPRPHDQVAPLDNRGDSAWCGHDANGWACTRPRGHNGLHYSDDGGWG